MAKVEFKSGHRLPAVCVICGNQSSSYVPHSFPYDETSKFVANLLVDFILALIFGGNHVYTNSRRYTTQLELNVPFCDRHINYFGAWGGAVKHLLRLFVIVMIPLGIWGGMTVWLPRYALGIEYAMLILAALIVIWTIVTIYYEMSSLRITKRAANSFRLHNVCRTFVEACEQAG